MSEYNYNNLEETASENVSEFEQCIAELSGKDAEGRPLATVSYQCYAMEEPDNAVAKQVSYTLTTPWVQMWIDKLHPGYICLDIAFRSFDDPELRLMWGRLNRHIKNMSKEPDKTWVFYIRILDNESIRIGKTEIKIAHVVNPLMFFLTRDLPTTQSDNQSSDMGLQGGNIIRMLIPEETVNLEISENEAYNLDTIRAEVARDIDEANYQNAVAEAGDMWSEENTSF